MSVARRLGRAWNRFWFEPVPASTAALVRIAIGLLCLGWALSLAPDIDAFYLEGGILPRPESRDVGPLVLGPLTHAPDWVILATWSTLVLASALVVVGRWSRLASIAMFLALVSLQRRNPHVLNGGDGLVRLLALYLVAIPGGAWLSLDRVRRTRDLSVVPLIAPWGLRLIQLQLCVVYLVAVWTKLSSHAWRDGSALAYAWRYEGIARFVPPRLVIDSPALIEPMTLASISIELAIPLLVWVRGARGWAIAAGIVLHLLIHATLQVGFFSLAIFACYLAFAPPDRSRAFVLGARDRLVRTGRTSASAEVAHAE